MDYSKRRNNEFDRIAKELKLNELSILLQSIYEKNEKKEVTWQSTTLDIQILKTAFNLKPKE